MALSAVNAKVISLFVLLVATVVAVFIPLRFHAMVSRPGGQVVLSLLASASGGLIFGTVLLHLMPEITESFNAFREEEGKDIDYPVMEVTIGFGFILIFLLEKGIGAIARRQKQQTAGKMQKNKDDPSAAEVSFNFKAGESDDQMSKNMTEFSKQTATDDVVRQNSTSELVESQGTAVCECAEVYEMLAHNPGIKEYAFVFALCLHALIEGVVVGFFDESSKVFTLLIGLALHKIPVAMALVIQLFRGRVKWKTTAVIGVVFSVISPVGIAIGTAIEESGSTNTPSGMLAESILQALGTGTLLYVVTMGILLTEFSAEDRHFQKCLCFLVGFLVIAAISFVPHEHDEHGHGAEHSDGECNMSDPHVH